LVEPSLCGFIEEGQTVEKGHSKLGERIRVLGYGMEKTSGGGGIKGSSYQSQESVHKVKRLKLLSAEYLESASPRLWV